MKKHLNEKIINAFHPSYHQVINESGQHNTTASNSHFKLIIVSEVFENVALIKRHRMVNELFAEELKQIHALAMHTYTAAEWQTKNRQAPNSPECAHK